MDKPNSKLTKGFTLIEILVVVSIIAILAALVLVSFSTPQKQANDTRRKNDLRQYTALLKEYAANNEGFYPCRPTAASLSGAFCTSYLGLDSSECPTDPKEGTGSFGYNVSSGNVDGTACTGPGTPSAANYVLYAVIEAQADSQYVVCSNGGAGIVTGTGSHSNGICPL